MKNNVKVIKNVISRKIIKPTYSPEFEFQKCRDLKVERSGFIDRSTLIKKMAIQGELNKYLNDYENNKLNGRSNDDLNKVIPVLNIKDMNRSDLIKAVRSRALFIDDKYKELSELQKQQASLMHNIDYNRLNSSGNSSPDNQAVEK